MIQYIYFVKCPGCEDEHFDFFDEAKDFALGCLRQQPVITQVEVDRNDFGECTDSRDLGPIWSWEEMIHDEPSTAECSRFSKKDTLGCVGGQCYDADTDPEFTSLDNSFDTALDSVPDNFRRPTSLSEEAGKELKTWICFYDNHDVASVEAYDEEEALRIFEDEYSSEYFFDSTDHDWGVEEADEDYTESCHRKPVPEGMSIKDLVEEMEQNEDTVECVGCEELFSKDECFYDDDLGWRCPDCEDRIVRCTWCEELYDKSECRYEVDLGYLCSRCEGGIKSRGEHLTFRESAKKSLVEASNSSTVNLEYENLEITLTGNKRDVDDWDEVEYVGDYTYSVERDEVATVIWENFITEEDVQDVPGGLDTLEDDAEWQKFLETHFDALFDKYYSQLLEYYRDEAIYSFQENYALADWEDEQFGDWLDAQYQASVDDDYDW